MKLNRDRTGGPAYAQIIDLIRDEIESGNLVPGDQLPPEREFAARLGVSRMTLRQALQELQTRGLVVRAIGRRGGTFVARPKLERDLGRFAGLSEQLRRQGMIAGAVVVSAQETGAARSVAEALELEPGAAVVEVVRIRLADEEPIALERSHLPADRFRGILGLDLTRSLYELLGDRFDAAPVRAVERIEPVLAGEEEADALRVDRGAPLMLVRRTAYDDAGAAVEHARDVFRGDRTRIVAWTSVLSAENA
jgi:DNA-binding GntR family transcriptional regulator